MAKTFTTDKPAILGPFAAAPELDGFILFKISDNGYADVTVQYGAYDVFDDVAGERFRVAGDRIADTSHISRRMQRRVVVDFVLGTLTVIG